MVNIRNSPPLANSSMKLLLFLGVLATASTQVWGAKPVDVMLVAADEAALVSVLDHLKNAQVETHAAWTLWTGTIDGKQAVVTRSEGDPLNAVAATTLVLRNYQPRLR